MSGGGQGGQGGGYPYYGQRGEFPSYGMGSGGYQGGMGGQAGMGGPLGSGMTGQGGMGQRWGAFGGQQPFRPPEYSVNQRPQTPMSGGGPGEEMVYAGGEGPNDLTNPANRGRLGNGFERFRQGGQTPGWNPMGGQQQPVGDPYRDYGPQAPTQAPQQAAGLLGQPSGFNPAQMNQFSNNVAGFQMPGATQAPGQNMAKGGPNIYSGGPPPTFPGDPRSPGYVPGVTGNNIMQQEYAQQRQQQMGLPAPYGRYPDGTPISPQNPNFRQQANQGRYGGGWGS